MLADQNGWDEEKRLTFKEGLDRLGDSFDNFIAIGRFNSERCRHVANLILAKKAVAVGFPNGATEPQIIPTYLFENDSFIRWDKSEVNGNNLHFVSVKVTKIRRAKQLLETPVGTKAKTSLRVGRRASSEIIDVIHKLNADPQFGKLLRKSQAELVIKYAREKMPERFPHGKGLHVSTVSRYLHQELGP